MNYPRTIPGERVENDWAPWPLPRNIIVADTAHIESAYSTPRYLSERPDGLVLGEGAGIYRGDVFVGPKGRLTVGDYACLNDCEVICEERIEIGAHSLVAWGAVITDCWSADLVPAAERRSALKMASQRPDRWIPPLARTRPVVLEENVWVGFDALVLPGVRLGRGCVIGARSVVVDDVPPYAVCVGSPARVVRFLAADDTQEARTLALVERRPD